MKLALIGINFKSTPLAVRERLSFTLERLPAELARLGACLPGVERVLISTCNRTELYVAGPGVPADLPTLARAFWPEAPTGAEAPAWYHERDRDAVLHLMRVASSLDSMVVGETEILAQVKQAYLTASQHGAAGPTLHALFQAALRVAKRVHADTGISRGRVSVSSIAVEFAERVFEDLRAKTVLIVGAGEVAEQALKSLVERGVGEVLVMNRSPERAQALAAAHGGQAVALDLLGEHLARADVTIASTSAPEPLVRHAAVAVAARLRRGRPMLLVDLSVPRNIEPAVASVDNVYLYHLDDLQRVAAENLAARHESVLHAQRLVQEGVLELATTFQPPDLGALLREVDEHAARIRDEALGRCFARPSVSGLPDAAREEITRAVDGALRKLLAAPREAIKEASRNGRWEDYARTVRDLFHFRDGGRGQS